MPFVLAIFLVIITVVAQTPLHAQTAPDVGEPIASESRGFGDRLSWSELTELIRNRVTYGDIWEVKFSVNITDTYFGVFSAGQDTAAVDPLGLVSPLTMGAEIGWDGSYVPVAGINASIPTPLGGNVLGIGAYTRLGTPRTIDIATWIKVAGLSAQMDVRETDGMYRLERFLKSVLLFELSGGSIPRIVYTSY